MELNDYQEKAMSTCMPSSNNFVYMMLNLMGEVGEFSSKVAKAVRKDMAEVNENELEFGFVVDAEKAKEIVGDNEKAMEIAKNQTLLWRGEDDELKKEAGDIAWQLAGLCHVMGWTLEDVCQMNLKKLSSRKDRGVIDGDGDNR